MEAKSSSGYNDISSKLLHKIIDTIAVPLSFIFNKSFTQGIFLTNLKLPKLPQFLKVAIVILSIIIDLCL